jgi:putative transposase
MLRKDPFVTGEYYHIYNRGVDKRVIFKSAHNYERFLMLLYICNTDQPIQLERLCSRGKKTYTDILSLDRNRNLVSVGAWCLMPNHFHILIKQEVDGGITKFMKKIGTAYSMYFNGMYKRQGALFGGPFKSKLVAEDDQYLRQLFGYIHLNPLDIKFPDWEKEKRRASSDMRFFLEGYRYSSYLEYRGKKRPESAILSIKAFPSYFKNIKEYTDFINSYFLNT